MKCRKSIFMAEFHCGCIAVLFLIDKVDENPRIAIKR